jgi:hypothetical protein
MATTPTPSAHVPVRPAVDEWGVYDPQQAGLSALFARLDSRNDAVKPKEEVLTEATEPVEAPERPSLRDAK